MPENGVVVNSARKEVINEDDLCIMKNVRILYTRYQADKHEEFEATPKRYFAPKNRAQTLEANINAGLAAARQIVAFFKNGDETFRVNLSREKKRLPF